MGLLAWAWIRLPFAVPRLAFGRRMCIGSLFCGIIALMRRYILLTRKRLPINAGDVPERGGIV
jgi:hypothetical protein